jgi:hypothetical protein
MVKCKCKCVHYTSITRSEIATLYNQRRKKIIFGFFWLQKGRIRRKLVENGSRCLDFVVFRSALMFCCLCDPTVPYFLIWRRWTSINFDIFWKLLILLELCSKLFEIAHVASIPFFYDTYLFWVSIYDLTLPYSTLFSHLTSPDFEILYFREFKENWVRFRYNSHHGASISLLYRQRFYFE